MKRTSLIGHVVELHGAIRHSHLPADNVVREFFRGRHYLGSKDRRFINDVIFGIIRNQILLEIHVKSAMNALGMNTWDPPLPPLALYIAYAARILHEDAESLLSDITPLARASLPDLDCAAFLSAVQVADVPPDILRDPVRRIASIHSIPEFIVAEWTRRFGDAETEHLCEALNNPAPITIRVNTLKATVEECRQALEREGVEARPAGVSPVGLVLEKRLNINALGSFRQGFFEMQDEGSQLLSLLLNPQPGEHVVDACAGSGGKSLHIAACMGNTGELLAVDTEEHRLRQLRERISRAGVSIVGACLVGRDDATLSAWSARAERVLIDAPCTGVGTFRRNPSSKLSLSETTVARLSETQHAVLTRYAGLVKPGGRLVYATCSLLEQENEHAVEWFLSTHQNFILHPVSDILTDQNIPLGDQSRYLTLFPHRHSTDGFFAAVMTRCG